MKILKSAFAITILLLELSSVDVFAKAAPIQRKNSAVENLKKIKTEEVTRETEKLVKDALNGVILTKSAYQDLDQDHSAEAKEKIVNALSEIDAAISANQGMELLPIEADSKVLTGIDDLSAALSRKDAALRLLNAGDVQAARVVLSPMVDELDIEVVDVPIELYKRKLNDALGLLEDEKKWEARNSLREALSLFVLTTDVIPIPLVEAEAFIDDAVNAEKNDKDKALEFLSKANNALLLAETLGYTTKDNASLWEKIQKENTKMSKVKHRQLNDKIEKKVNDFDNKIKNENSDIYNKMKEVIVKIKDHLALKK